MNSKTFIGYINETLKGYRIVTGKAIDRERAHKILDAITGDLDIDQPETKEILEYCYNHYDYKTDRISREALFLHAEKALSLLKKSLIPVVFLFISFSVSAQFLTVPKDDINTQFGAFVDPTFTDEGAQLGALAVMVMHWGYVSAQLSTYPDLNDTGYTDAVGELGVNGHFGGFEPLRTFAGFRLGGCWRGGQFFSLVGGAVGVDFMFWKISETRFFIGGRLWADYRTDQEDRFFGDSDNYKKGVIIDNNMIQENGAFVLSFSL